MNPDLVHEARSLERMRAHLLDIRDRRPLDAIESEQLAMVDVELESMLEKIATESRRLSVDTELDRLLEHAFRVCPGVDAD